MENVLEFKGEKYYAVGCCNFYRTEDGKNVFSTFSKSSCMVIF